MGGAKGILDGFLPVMLSGGYVADNRSNFVEHYTGLDDIPLSRSPSHGKGRRGWALFA